MGLVLRVAGQLVSAAAMAMVVVVRITVGGHRARRSKLLVVPERGRRTAHVRQRVSHAIATAVALAVVGVVLRRREGGVSVKAGPFAQAWRRAWRHRRRDRVKRGRHLADWNHSGQRARRRQRSAPIKRVRIGCVRRAPSATSAHAWGAEQSVRSCQRTTHGRHEVSRNWRRRRRGPRSLEHRECRRSLAPQQNFLHARNRRWLVLGLRKVRHRTDRWCSRLESKCGQRTEPDAEIAASARH